MPGEWITAPETRAERVVLYLHGGSFAFRFPTAHASLAARLCRRLGARALIPDYRLAPEHPFPAAPDDCHAAYRGLLAQGVDPGSIVLAGDSAGGNLALVTLVRARAAGEPLPSCAVLLSPAVDCTMGSPSMSAYDGRDPMIRLASLLVLRRLYVPSPHLYTNPEVSPLFADFTGFPPLFFQTGHHRAAARRGDPCGRQGLRGRRRRRARAVAGCGARVPARGFPPGGRARDRSHRALRPHAHGVGRHCRPALTPPTLTVPARTIDDIRAR